jgi:hypothetical protein
MSIDEACQILNVTRDAELAEITKVSHKELAAEWQCGMAERSWARLYRIRWDWRG